MRAVVLRSHGGPDVLQFEDVASPIIGEQDILVTVAATALNRADLLQRMGFYPNPFPSGPEIPGLEFAGTVAAIGEKVTAWSIGDRVMGITSGGAYAEQLSIHERQAMAVPSGVSLQDAAGIPAASCNGIPDGTAIAWRSCIASCSAYAPPLVIPMT